MCAFFFFANSNGGRNRNEKIKNDYRAKEGKKKKDLDLATYGRLHRRGRRAFCSAAW